MRTDPEPMNAVRYGQPERSVVEADSDAVESAVADSLKMQ